MEGAEDMTELASTIDERLYPDVAAAGGLVEAFRFHLESLGMKIEVAGGAPEVSLACARVERAGRSSTLYAAARERLFLFDFWSKGVHMGTGTSGDLSVTAEAVVRWLDGEAGVAEMESAFPFFEKTEQAPAFEQGRGLDYQWRRLGTVLAETLPELVPLLEEAVRRPELRKLFPYTNLNRLCFSRTTGAPYTKDCPFAQPMPGGRFVVMTHDHDEKEQDTIPDDVRTAVLGPVHILGEGNASEAAQLIVEGLPEGCGRAVDGTSDDLQN
jgi:hypothetical protein